MKPILSIVLVVIPSLVWAAEGQVESLARARAAAMVAYAALSAESGPAPLQASPNPTKACTCDDCQCDPCRCDTRPSRRTAVGYKEAHEHFKRDGRPMVVMVTATWCPACPAVKRELERMLKDGELDDCSLVFVDYDQATETAKKVLGRQRTLPYVVAYYRQGEKERAARGIQPRDVPRILGR